MVLRNTYRRGGCERIANDAPTIGDTMTTSSQHNEIMLEIEGLKKKLRVLREHRNRIKHAYEFLEKNYNEYFTLGTREITEEDPHD